MKKILKWLSLLFAVSVFIFVLFFIYSINANISVQKPQPLEFNSTIEDQEAQALWLNHLSKAQKKGYYFPVNEVYIETELVAKPKKQQHYQLLVEEIDPYSVFCIKQELQRFHIPYYFRKSGKKLTFIVESPNQQKLKSLVKVLKKYQIKAKISKR